MRALSTKLLIFFNLIGISSLFYLLINAYDKPILYEDSFVLLKPLEINLFYWLLTPHNNHIMLISKLMSYVLNVLNLYPTTFFIPLGVLIIFIGLYFLWQIIKTITRNGKNNIIIFLIVSYFWISPWHWENLIWEFQFPWFIISTFTIISTFIFLNKNEEENFKIYEKIFLFLSPLIAVASTAACILYVNCLLLNYFIRYRFEKFPFLGIFLSYSLFLTVRLFNFTDDNISFDIVKNFKYIIIMLLTIFKAPISSNNSYSYFQWIIPIFSSLIFQLFLIVNINWRKFIKNISLNNKIALFNPIIFSLQFAIITSLSRADYGIHQGAVSRYLTCLVLFPIGLIFLFEYTNNITNADLDKNYLSNKLFSLTKSNTFNLIIIICLIINTSSFLKTVYETHISTNIRYQNFKIFQQACINRNKANSEFLLKENFRKLKNYHVTNIPPFPDAKNIKTYRKYINSDLCDLTNAYFN